MTMMQHRQIRYLGLDVHKATIAVAIAEEAGAPASYGTIPNDAAAIRKLMVRLGHEQVELRVAYEAGPTGYALHRQLAKMGIDCLVAAPSLIPKRAGDKVKTDRRDALKLARLLRSGDLTPVWVPDEAHEALRNLVRARADAKADQLRAKHRLSKLLLRQGCWPPMGVRNWTQRYVAWLRQLEFEHLPDRVVFADYLAEVTAAGERIQRLEAALHQCAQSSSQVAVIRALQAFRGIGFLSAVTLVAETGDVRRFRTAPQFMAYVGVVPSESSSGGKQQRGPITKTGNTLLRHVLGEAAHHARHAPRISGTLRRRQTDLPREIVELAWRAQLRLHTRYRHLSLRIGTLKALTAIARELAGFIWAAGHVLQEVSAAT
jgi:transposase